MIDSILSTAANGLLTSSRDAAKAASDIVGASSTRQEQDLLPAIVDLKTSQVQFNANATVLRTGDEMSGQLLDILV